jgi:glutamate/aspartate transport system permease protein
MRYELDWSSIPGALPVLLAGMKLTLLITLVSIAAGVTWGTILALFRLSPIRALSLLQRGYVSLFRSVPLLLVLFWFYLVVPQLLRSTFHLSAATDTRLVSAMVGFSLFEAAYYSEIVRAGIQSVSRGQVAAAQALGMTYGQTMRLVVLPQAFRHMMPLLLTQAIIVFQDTSLVYIMSLSEFFVTAYTVGQRDGRLVELLLFAGAVYFVLCSSAAFLVKQLQRRLASAST